MQVLGSRRFGSDQSIVAAHGDEELPHQHDERSPNRKDDERSPFVKTWNTPKILGPFTYVNDLVASFVRNLGGFIGRIQPYFMFLQRRARGFVE